MRYNCPMTTCEDIRRALAGHRPLHLSHEDRMRAAVALLLRPGRSGPEVLFIERARHDDDPWSGDLGFPGGKIEAHDTGPQAAAERETAEELGIDLAEACLLGRLDDLVGAHLPVVVSCFVYWHDAPAPCVPGDEVRRAFWIPLDRLAAPRRHAEATVVFDGERLRRPAIRLLDDDGPLLWGITYRLVLSFLTLLRQTGKRLEVPSI